MGRFQSPLQVTARSSPSRRPRRDARNPVLVKRFEQEFRGRQPARTIRTSSRRSNTTRFSSTPFLVMEVRRRRVARPQGRTRGALPEEWPCTFSPRSATACTGLTSRASSTAT